MYVQHEALEVRSPRVYRPRKKDFLDVVLEQLKDGDIVGGMVELGNQLYDTYALTSTADWERLVRDEFLRHPLRDALMEDPHTARSVVKPRGYSGDAVLLDMVYYPERLDMSDVSELGQGLFRFNTRTNIAKALRQRMSTVARVIDETVAANPQARVLSVACGHCREVEFSEALKTGSVDTFIGLDQDRLSLDLAEQEYGNLGFVPAHTTVADVIKGNVDLGQFDLVYSAGLYDYLGRRTAQRLTAELYKMLKPGGRLLLINIASDYPEVGYFESFMDWSMIGRGKTDLLDLTSRLPVTESASVSIGEENVMDTYYYYIDVVKA
jgi:extracellular factor (EF) 3-hydroxypalmitic acid methyl ester biosynthesis protein